MACRIPLIRSVNGNGNGIPLNGISFNAIPLNGISFNGIPLNGISFNGIPFNRIPLCFHLQTAQMEFYIPFKCAVANGSMR